jgi:hypothetical protein
MSITLCRAAFMPAGFTVLAFTGACSTASKPAPPKPGTIAHSWMVSHDAYNAGDYQKVNEHLSRLSSSRSEYTERAKVWSFIVTSGVVSGYRELADAYEDAARTSKTSGADYRKRMSNARRAANQSAMMLVQNLHDYFKESKDSKIVFDFAFPKGKVSEPLQLLKLKRGLPMQASDYDVLEKSMLERAVVQVATEVGGAPGDPQKAQDQFKEPSKQAFMQAMARMLYDTASLYGPRKLDEPRRMHVFLNEALNALISVPEGSDKKQIEAKIRDLMKKHPLKEG